jgi:hypothetical protein
MKISTDTKYEEREKVKILIKYELKVINRKYYIETNIKECFRKLLNQMRKNWNWYTIVNSKVIKDNDRFDTAHNNKTFYIILKMIGESNTKDGQTKQDTKNKDEHQEDNNYGSHKRKRNRYCKKPDYVEKKSKKLEKRLEKKYGSN